MQGTESYSTRPMVNFTAIIQARMSSNRLPGKVLKEIEGKSLLEILISRLAKSQKINRIVVATSIDPSDDIIEEFCKKNNHDYFRGDLNDVLKRFYDCSKIFPSQNYIRITADCPLHDIKLIDKAIENFEKDQLDYLTNTFPPTYPDGLDFWIFKNELLEIAHQKAEKLSEREHVTLFFNNNFGSFKSKNIVSDINLEHLRWTVDTIEDFALIQQILTTFSTDMESVSTPEILNLLNNHPDLSLMNKNSERDEGLKISLEKEKG